MIKIPPLSQIMRAYIVLLFFAASLTLSPLSVILLFPFVFALTVRRLVMLSVDVSRRSLGRPVPAAQVQSAA
jgi:hypothetical protein